MSDQYPMPHGEPSAYEPGGDSQQSSYDQPSYASYSQPVSSTYARRDDMRSPYDHPMIPSYGEWRQPSQSPRATSKPLIIILIIVIIITAMTATGLTVWALTRSDTTAAPSVEPTTQSTTPKDKSDTGTTGGGRKNTTSQPETSTQSAPQTDTQSETSSDGDLSMNSLNNGDYQTAQEFIDSPEIQQQLQTTGSNVTLTATGPNSVTYVETLSTNTRPSYMSDKALDGLARIQAETFNRNILNGCTVRIILRYQNGETFYDHTFQRTNQ